MIPNSLILRLLLLLIYTTESADAALFRTSISNRRQPSRQRVRPQVTVLSDSTGSLNLLESEPSPTPASIDNDLDTGLLFNPGAGTATSTLENDANALNLNSEGDATFLSQLYVEQSDMNFLNILGDNIPHNNSPDDATVGISSSNDLSSLLENLSLYARTNVESTTEKFKDMLKESTGSMSRSLKQSGNSRGRTRKNRLSRSDDYEYDIDNLFAASSGSINNLPLQIDRITDFTAKNFGKTTLNNYFTPTNGPTYTVVTPWNIGYFPSIAKPTENSESAPTNDKTNSDIFTSAIAPLFYSRRIRNLIKNKEGNPLAIGNRNLSGHTYLLKMAYSEVAKAKVELEKIRLAFRGGKMEDDLKLMIPNQIGPETYSISGILKRNQQPLYVNDTTIGGNSTKISNSKKLNSITAKESIKQLFFMMDKLGRRKLYHSSVDMALIMMLNSLHSEVLSENVCMRNAERLVPDQEPLFVEKQNNKGVYYDPMKYMDRDRDEYALTSGNSTALNSTITGTTSTVDSLYFKGKGVTFELPVFRRPKDHYESIGNRVTPQGRYHKEEMRCFILTKEKLLESTVTSGDTVTAEEKYNQEGTNVVVKEIPPVDGPSTGGKIIGNLSDGVSDTDNTRVFTHSNSVRNLIKKFESGKTTLNQVDESETLTAAAPVTGSDPKIDISTVGEFLDIQTVLDQYLEGEKVIGTNHIGIRTEIELPVVKDSNDKTEKSGTVGSVVSESEVETKPEKFNLQVPEQHKMSNTGISSKSSKIDKITDHKDDDTPAPTEKQYATLAPTYKTDDTPAPTEKQYATLAPTYKSTPIVYSNSLPLKGTLKKFKIRFNLAAVLDQDVGIPFHQGKLEKYGFIPWYFPYENREKWQEGMEKEAGVIDTEILEELNRDLDSNAGSSNDKSGASSSCSSKDDAPSTYPNKLTFRNHFETIEMSVHDDLHRSKLACIAWSHGETETFRQSTNIRNWQQYVDGEMKKAGIHNRDTFKKFIKEMIVEEEEYNRENDEIRAEAMAVSGDSISYSNANKVLYMPHLKYRTAGVIEEKINNLDWWVFWPKQELVPVWEKTEVETTEEAKSNTATSRFKSLLSKKILSRFLSKNHDSSENLTLKWKKLGTARNSRANVDSEALNNIESPPSPRWTLSPYFIKNELNPIVTILRNRDFYKDPQIKKLLLSFPTNHRSNILSTISRSLPTKYDLVDFNFSSYGGFSEYWKQLDSRIYSSRRSELLMSIREIDWHDNEEFIKIYNQLGWGTTPSKHFKNDETAHKIHEKLTKCIKGQGGLKEGTGNTSSREDLSESDTEREIESDSVSDREDSNHAVEPLEEDNHFSVEPSDQSVFQQEETVTQSYTGAGLGMKYNENDINISIPPVETDSSISSVRLRADQQTPQTSILHRRASSVPAGGRKFSRKTAISPLIDTGQDTENAFSASDSSKNRRCTSFSSSTISNRCKNLKKKLSLKKSKLRTKCADSDLWQRQRYALSESLHFCDDIYTYYLPPEVFCLGSSICWGTCFSVNCCCKAFCHCRPHHSLIYSPYNKDSIFHCCNPIPGKYYTCHDIESCCMLSTFKDIAKTLISGCNNIGVCNYCNIDESGVNSINNCINNCKCCGNCDENHSFGTAPCCENTSSCCHTCFDTLPDTIDKIIFGGGSFEGRYLPFGLGPISYNDMIEQCQNIVSILTCDICRKGIVGGIYDCASTPYGGCCPVSGTDAINAVGNYGSKSVTTTMELLGMGTISEFYKNLNPFCCFSPGICSGEILASAVTTITSKSSTAAVVGTSSRCLLHVFLTVLCSLTSCVAKPGIGCTLYKCYYIQKRAKQRQARDRHKTLIDGVETIFLEKLRQESYKKIEGYGERRVVT